MSPGLHTHYGTSSLISDCPYVPDSLEFPFLISGQKVKDFQLPLIYSFHNCVCPQTKGQDGNKCNLSKGLGTKVPLGRNMVSSYHHHTSLLKDPCVALSSSCLLLLTLEHPWDAAFCICPGLITRCSSTHASMHCV